MRIKLRGASVVLGCSVLILVVSCGPNPVAPSDNQNTTAFGAAVTQKDDRPFTGSATGQTSFGQGATELGVTMNQGGERPFTGRAAGHASFDLTNPRGCAAGFTTVTDAGGTATHLGLTSFHSEHCVTPTGGIEGSVVLSAANGDEVHGTYTGTSTAPGEIGEPIYATAHIVISGGTGRFANATGQAALAATITFEGFEKPTWPGQWEWTGSIRY
jgi:hypothetical protein